MEFIYKLYIILKPRYEKYDVFLNSLRSDQPILSKLDIFILLVYIVLPTADNVTDIRFGVVLTTGNYDPAWECCKNDTDSYNTSIGKSKF